jgi:phosphatidylinositol alpha-1,6-mannosyltransferase
MVSPAIDGVLRTSFAPASRQVLGPGEPETKRAAAGAAKPEGEAEVVRHAEGEAVRHTRCAAQPPHPHVPAPPALPLPHSPALPLSPSPTLPVSPSPHRDGVRSLLLATSFPPNLGGMETLLYQTSRRLAQPPLVVAPHPASAPDLNVCQVRTTPRGLPGRIGYRATWPLHPSLHYLATFWKPTLAALRTVRPEVVQCGHVFLAPLAWLVARRLRRPLVVYAYGQEVWRNGRPLGLALLDRLLRGRALASADTILSLGGFASSLLYEWGVPPPRVVSIPFGAEPRQPVPPPEGATLLSVCRLVPRKGVDTVIRALPAVARAVPDIQYRVVGSGQDEPRLRNLAAAEGVADRVHFLGRLDVDALAHEYQRCALFVLPSRRTPEGELEGLGLVYFEAAAWGRPVLAGRSGGEVDAVEDHVTGRLVDGTSVEAVAAALAELLADPARLRALGEAGRRRVETTHNWSRAAAAVDAVLQRVFHAG